MIGGYRRTRAIVRPTSGDRAGIRCSSSIAVGARAAVRRRAQNQSCARTSAGDIAIEDEGAFLDVDTEEEYRKTIASRFGGAEDDR